MFIFAGVERGRLLTDDKAFRSAQEGCKIGFSEMSLWREFRMRIRTGYSFRSAVGTLKNVFDRQKEIGLPFFPITDRGSLFGWVKWQTMCEKEGVKPIFGIELGVSPEPTAKKPIIDHWTFVADGSVVPINLLLETATAQFRYEPLLTLDQALGADCFKIIGNRTSLDDIDPADERLFVGLSPSLMPGQFKRAKELGFKFIACSDNVYTNDGDSPFYEVVCGRGASTQTYPQFILDRQQWLESVNRAAEADDKDSAWGNLLETGKQCSARLKKGTLLVPEKPTSLREMCESAAPGLGVDLSDPIYAARLNKELDLIELKKFEDYFYIISDLVIWARERMIVGPARGSSCGSLVCYLLKITTVDPIPYGLIFERFIDLNRDDLPDIDIDFSDQKRHLVFEYMEDKYGSDRIARLGTVAMYRPASAVKETAAALKVPRWKAEKALDALIERSSGDSRALDTLEDTLRTTPNGRELLEEYPEMLVACSMEGHPRHHSQHAAGIILTEEPVREYIGVDARTNATHCDKKDAEELDLLKIDALGLTQLSVFEDTLDLAGLPHDYLESVPLDDQVAFDVMNKGYFSGIFQFNGPALQSLAYQVDIQELDDIVAITALARPGPMASGGATEWVMRKNGVHKTTVPHELFKPYLEDTRGIVMYQEQVMEIGRNIGDLTWGDVTALRKAMSKSLGKEYFDQFGDRWKSAASKKGIPDDVLTKVWDDLCAYGAWAFNKSHSVAYGLISYWCCWLKGHYPVEFAAATLNHEKDPDRQLNMLREMASEGIGYVPVDAETSTDRWAIVEKSGVKSLAGPVTNVKGIGPKLAQQIVEARSKGQKIPERAQKLLANPVTKIDSLWPIRDRINEIMPDPRDRNILTEPTLIGDMERHDDWHDYLLFVVANGINPRDENEVVNIAKRGGTRITDGKTASLNLELKDDTGVTHAKINRFKYEQFGKDIVERGRPGKAIYAMKGSLIPDSNFMIVKMVRYIGDMEND
jgi:DNA polymerase III alpha subunit